MQCINSTCRPAPHLPAYVVHMTIRSLLTVSLKYDLLQAELVSMLFCLLACYSVSIHSSLSPNCTNHSNFHHRLSRQSSKVYHGSLPFAQSTDDDDDGPMCSDLPRTRLTPLTRTRLGFDAALPLGSRPTTPPIAERNGARAGREASEGRPGGRQRRRRRNSSSGAHTQRQRDKHMFELDSQVFDLPILAHPFCVSDIPRTLFVYQIHRTPYLCIRYTAHKPYKSNSRHTMIARTALRTALRQQQQATASSSRLFSSSAASWKNVAVLGASGGIGQPVSVSSPGNNVL